MTSVESISKNFSPKKDPSAPGNNLAEKQAAMSPNLIGAATRGATSSSALAASSPPNPSSRRKSSSGGSSYLPVGKTEAETGITTMVTEQAVARATAVGETADASSPQNVPYEDLGLGGVYAAEKPLSFRARWTGAIFGVVLLAFLFAYYCLRSGKEQWDYVVEPHRQPKVDERKYAYKMFSNGLRFVGIQDKESKKAGMAVLVNAGSLRDPDESLYSMTNTINPTKGKTAITGAAGETVNGIPGLAHLIEHTVLIGSKKYPGKTEWDDFQEKYLGDSNAFTGEDRTVYYIGLVNDGLEECMDRVSDFMFNPTFGAATEMNAVEAEHQKNIQSPGWRIQELKNYVFDPKGLGRFGTGNLQTLKRDSIVEDMKVFHQRYYYPADMTMVTISPDSLEKQLERAAKYFGRQPAPSNPFVDPRPYVVQPVYGRYVHMFDENSPTPRLILNFPVEMDITPYYRSGVGAYLGHLLNYESMKKKQGLQAELLDKGWIFGSGFDIGGSSYLTTISFSASLRHPQFAENVVNEFYRYLRIVKKEIHLDVYESLQKLDNFYWDWRKDDGDRADLATAYAELLVENHPPEDLLMSGMMKMDTEFLRKMINMIIPERMSVLITEKSGAPDGSAAEGWGVKQLPYYNVPYTEGLWRVQYLKDILAGTDAESVAQAQQKDFVEYTLPPALKPPPVIDHTPEDFYHPFTKELPFGPSPEKLDGTIWYRWGSTTKEPNFKFFIRLYARIDRDFLLDDDFEKHAVFRLMWSRLLARKLGPILEQAESCSCVVDKDARYKNLMGVTIRLGGFYSAACDEILMKVLDTLMNLRDPSGTVQNSVRGTENVSRMVEALYLDLTDHTSKMPYNFALGGLGTVEGENDITTESLASTVKALRDQKLAEMKREPLPEANGLLKVEDYLPAKDQPLPDHMPKRPLTAAENMQLVPNSKSLNIDPTKTDSIAKVDELVARILYDENLHAEGMAFGGITKEDARRLRDLIINKINEKRDTTKLTIKWNSKENPIPFKKSTRILNKPVDLQMHNKRLDDTNDVTFVRITKPSKKAQFTGPDGTAISSMHEIFIHKMLGVMFSSFTFSRLRTLVLEKQGKQRYIVFGSVGSNAGTSFDVDVLVQTNKENLEEVKQEIEKHIYTDFKDFLTKEVTEKEFETRKKSILSKLNSKADSFGSEYGHFAGALDVPYGEPTECIFQMQKVKREVVQSLKLEEVRAAWDDFLVKEKTMRKQVVLYHDLNMELDKKKTVAAYQAAKKNYENLDWMPQFAAYQECMES
ncbi:unnamed protein product [Amoebophrya sp. A120]|nr:unnamed protein product [Amoebophrya sp. A120]|eukprot:GSA120T00007879001.1